MVMFTVPDDSTLYKTCCSLTERDGASNKIFMVQQSISFIPPGVLQITTVCFDQATMIFKTMEEINIYYNCKHFKINVEWCLFVLNSIFSLHRDIFSKDCVKINTG